MPHCRPPLRRHAAVILLCLAAGLPAQAAELQLEEIIVTARKRPEPLQQVPLSLLALDREQLRNGAVTDLADLRQQVPGLQLLPHPNAEGTLRVYLRGIGNSDEQLTQDPSVAVYADGVYLPRSQGLGLELLDLERVEVLRGPQGTLYGRNATGGAINYVSQRPATDALRWEHSITTGSRGLLRNRTTVNLPLSPQLGLRLGRMTVREDGFVKNAGTGASRFGDRERAATRVDLLWQALPQISLRYVLDDSRLADSPAFIGRVPLEAGYQAAPRAGSAAVRNLPLNSAVTRSHSLTAEWTLGNGATLRSLSNLRTLADSQFQDYHSGVFSPLPLLQTSAAGEQRQRSQELQLLSASEQRISYVLGAYWFLEDATRGAGNFTPANKTNRLVQGRDVQNRSRALYGQVQWTPAALPALSLGLGVRRSLDERRALVERFVQNTGTGVTTRNPVPGAGRAQFSDTSPALTASWQWSAGTVLYAKVERGYKSGGFNVRASTPARFNEGFDDESLVSRELGLKWDAADRRARAALALFDARYDDIQINVQSDPTNIVLSDVLNAGSARIRGAELDADLLLGSAWRLYGHYAHLLPQLETVRNARGQNVAGQYRFMAAPDQALTLGAEVLLPSAGLGELTASVHHAWQSETYGSATFDAGRYVLDAWGVTDARLRWTMAQGDYTLDLSLWARNLADKDYYLAHFNGGAGAPVPSAIWAAPRSVGLDFRLSYE